MTVLVTQLEKKNENFWEMHRAGRCYWQGDFVPRVLGEKGWQVMLMRMMFYEQEKSCKKLK